MMSERTLPLMDRLKAIRDRIAAESDEAADNKAEAKGDAAENLFHDASDDKAEASSGATVHPFKAASAAVDEFVDEPVDEANTDAAAAGAKSMWDMAVEADETASDAETNTPAAALDAAPQASDDSAVEEDQRPIRRTGRVKARLLGFEHSNGESVDVFAGADSAAAAVRDDRFAVGWVVVRKGPGRGEVRALKPGVSFIGRGEDQAIQLDFGDTSISRTNHAAIAYDDEDRSFYIGHGGKSNMVRLNGKPLLSTEKLSHGDEVRVGETTLRIVMLCGPEFSWSDGADTAKPGNS